MIEAMGKQIVRQLELVTGDQLLHTLEFLIDSGCWIDAVQRTSELMFGSADYLIVYHSVNAVDHLAAAKGDSHV